MTKCEECKDKYCEHYLNEDSECIPQPLSLLQAIASGFIKVVDLIKPQPTEVKDENPPLAR